GRRRAHDDRHADGEHDPVGPPPPRRRPAMSRPGERDLKRVLEEVSRSPRRRRRGAGTAPLMLGLALFLGHQLLVQLVPRAWAALLPGGLAQARQFRGWPGLLYASAEACYRHGGPAM